MVSTRPSIRLEEVAESSKLPSLEKERAEKTPAELSLIRMK